MSSSVIRQNFHEASEAAINKQINMELEASYTYQAMALYFDRHDVALPGFAKFYKKSSEEERDHAEKLMKYQNKRGGRVTYAEVKAPKTEYGSGLESLEFTLKLEKDVNASLLTLHGVATEHNDAHLADYLESEFLNEQVESISKLGEYITKLKRAGPTGLGEYLFDKDFQ